MSSFSISKLLPCNCPYSDCWYLRPFSSSDRKRNPEGLPWCFSFLTPRSHGGSSINIHLEGTSFHSLHHFSQSGWLAATRCPTEPSAEPSPALLSWAPSSLAQLQWLSLREKPRVGVVVHKALHGHPSCPLWLYQVPLPCGLSDCPG